MGVMNDTLSDIGSGTGNLLIAIVPALLLLVIGLGVGYGIKALLTRSITKV